MKKEEILNSQQFGFSGGQKESALKAMDEYAKAKWDEACEAQKSIIKDRYYDIEVDLDDVVIHAPKPEFKP